MNEENTKTLRHFPKVLLLQLQDSMLKKQQIIIDLCKLNNLDLKRKQKIQADDEIIHAIQYIYIYIWSLYENLRGIKRSISQVCIPKDVTAAYNPLPRGNNH